MPTLTTRRWGARISAVVILLSLLAMRGGGLGNEPASPTPDPLAGLPRGCMVTPDAVPRVTIEIVGRAFGEPVTVEAGAAVEFVNRDATSHTVTEGIAGHADYATACVTQRLHPGASVVVAFAEPGDYPITCTIHASMHTTVYVR